MSTGSTGIHQHPTLQGGSPPPHKVGDLLESPGLPRNKYEIILLEKVNKSSVTIIRIFKGWRHKGQKIEIFAKKILTFL